MTKGDLPPKKESNYDVSLEGLSEALRVSLSKSFQDYSTKYGSQPIDADKLNYIVNNYRDPLAHHPSLETKADMEKQVDKKVNELKKRIEVMAARSTQENRSQKVSSV